MHDVLSILQGWIGQGVRTAVDERRDHDTWRVVAGFDGVQLGVRETEDKGVVTVGCYGLEQSRIGIAKDVRSPCRYVHYACRAKAEDPDPEIR